MKRTIKEVYDLIKEKRDNAEKRYQVTKHKELGGTIDAYQDVLCLIESSHLLEDERIESKGLDALEQLKYYNTFANDDFDMTHEIKIIEKELKKVKELECELHEIRSGKIRLSVKTGENYIAMPKYQYEQFLKRDKVMRIIKEKGILQFCMWGISLDDYNKSIDIANKEYLHNNYRHLTQEEYDLVREVLL